MNHRLTSLLDSKTATDAGTETIDINLSQPVSAIMIQYKGTNNGSVPTAHPAKMISKIEISDGSEILHSLSGIQEQALNYFNTGRMPVSVLDYRNDVMAIVTYFVMFGRYLWDEQLALNPTKHKNPQLRISHNKALGGSSPDASTIDVYAFAFDEKTINPVGYLQSKEQINYSLVSSAVHPIDLAVDHDYRMIMIQSLSAGKQPHEQYNRVKLSQDNDARVLINNLPTSVLAKMLDFYPAIVEDIFALDLDGAETVYCTPTYNTSLSALGLSAADTALFTAQSFGGSFVATGGDGKHSQWIARGKNPHGSLAIPFGKQDVIEDWYKMDPVGSLKLQITAGSSVGGSSICSIVSQQLKRYAT